jgi:hypothetical protein
VSSLNVRTEPWVAMPSPDTTIGQISQALVAFPDLRILVGDDLDVTLVLAHRRATPPPTDDLAQAMFGDDAGLVSTEHTGEHAKLELAFDVEAADRNAEGA